MIQGANERWQQAPLGTGWQGICGERWRNIHLCVCVCVLTNALTVLEVISIAICHGGGCDPGLVECPKKKYTPLVINRLITIRIKKINSDLPQTAHNTYTASLTPDTPIMNHHSITRSLNARANNKWDNAADQQPRAIANTSPQDYSWIFQSLAPDPPPERPRHHIS